MSSTANVSSRQRRSRYERFLALLQAELSPYPGRTFTVVRIVLACTLMMLCVEVFRIPGGVWGAYYPLLISRDNLRATRRSAVWIIVFCAIGTIEVVLGAMLFLGSPFLHFLWICVSLFAVFYLISSLRIYEVGLALGIFIANSITIWDLPLSADHRLEQTLFMFLSIAVGCAITVLVEYLFSRSHRLDTVHEGIAQRLDVASQVLNGYGNYGSISLHAAHRARRYSMRGTAGLRELISSSPYPAAERQRLSTALALSGRLVDLSWNLVEVRPNTGPADLEFCYVVCQKIDTLRNHLLRDEAAEWVDLDEVPTTDIPMLIEIQRTADLMAESLSPSVWGELVASDNYEPVSRNKSLFVTNGFSDHEHLRFAVRGSLSALACYLIYMSVSWTALGASIATCILTALPITGAARHKQLMRFSGVLIGSCVLGFAAQIFLLPQIDSIFSYLLLFAFILSLGAWISTSTPRLAYTGTQMVLAYELVNLNRFSINPSLIPARDVCLGILLGIGAMWLFFDHLWSTSSRESLRILFVAAFQNIAALDRTAGEEQTNGTSLPLESQADRIMRGFEKMGSTIDVSVFETHPASISDEFLLQRARGWLSQLRTALLLKTGLIHHQATVQRRDEGDLVGRTQARCSEMFLQSAQQIMGSVPEADNRHVLANQALQKELHANLIQAAQHGSKKDLIEARLCLSLFTVVHDLANAVGEGP